MKSSPLELLIKKQEERGDLIRIKKYINPELEITEITDRISKTEKGGKAILFENTGKKFPLLINAMGSYDRMCEVLNVQNLDTIGEEIEQLLKSFTNQRAGIMEKLKLLPKLGKLASWMPKVSNRRGECQEVINKNPNINELPVLKCWPADGGKFITLPMVNTKDPDTGIRNVGMYRMQIFSDTTTGMHWHRHKVGARHYEAYKRKGMKMPIAVALGGDLVNTYSATAPLPDNIDEYMLSGFLRKKRVELVKCITQDIEVPADADFVIEGYVDTAEDFKIEGPFGDHTGFYSLPDYYPVFHITCITHRKNAIYPATIVGIPPQEDAYIAKATERIFLAPIKLTILPEFVDMNLPVAGVAHNLAIISIKKSFPAHGIKVMNAIWGAGQMMFNKILIIVDESVDVHNYIEVLNAIAYNTKPSEDIHFSKGPLDVLDHSATKMSFGGKMCIDATTKLPEELQDDKRQVKKPEIDKNAILKEYPFIKDINSYLVEKNIPLVWFAIDKQEIDKIKEVLKTDYIKNIRYILLVDAEVNINNFMTASWICANNTEPWRDCKFAEEDTLIIDGTRKNKEIDGYKRDWPNVIVSKQETIKDVDKMWSDLGLGAFVPSPSLDFINYKKGDGAVFKS